MERRSTRNRSISLDDGIAERTDKTMADYNKDFAELAQMRAIKAEAEAAIAEIEERIKEQMLAEGKDTIIGTEHKATYKEVTSNRFDSKAFKADGYEDLYKAYQKPSTSMRFTFA